MASSINLSTSTPSLAPQDKGKGPMLRERDELVKLQKEYLALSTHIQGFVNDYAIKASKKGGPSTTKFLNLQSVSVTTGEKIDECFRYYDLIEKKSGKRAELPKIESMRGLVDLLLASIANNQKKIGEIEQEMAQVEALLASAEIPYLEAVESERERIQESYLSQGYQARIGARWLRFEKEIDEAKLDGERVERSIPANQKEQGYIGYIKPHIEKSSMRIARAYLQGRFIQWQKEGCETISICDRQSPLDREFRLLREKRGNLSSQLNKVKNELKELEKRSKSAQQELDKEKREVAKLESEEDLITSYLSAEKKFISSFEKMKQVAQEVEKAVRPSIKKEEKGEASSSNERPQERWKKQLALIDNRFKKIEAAAANYSGEKKESFVQLVNERQKLLRLFSETEKIVNRSDDEPPIKRSLDLDRLINETEREQIEILAQCESLKGKLAEVQKSYYDACRPLMLEFKEKYFSKGYSAKIMGYWLKTEDQIAEAKEYKEVVREVDPSKNKGFIAVIPNRVVKEEEEKFPVALAYLQGRGIEWRKDQEVPIVMKEDPSEVYKESRATLAQKRALQRKLVELNQYKIKLEEEFNKIGDAIGLERDTYTQWRDSEKAFKESLEAVETLLNKF